MAKDWYKKKKAVSLDERIEVGQVPIDHNIDPQTQAQYQEILDIIADLDEMDKELLLLKYVEGLDPKDIAHILGETANVISVRLHRSTERLRKKLHV